MSEQLTANCETISCSIYLSRKETRFLADHGVKAAVTSLRIPDAGPFLFAAEALATVKAKEATRKHQCLRIRTGFIIGLYSDGGKYCKD